MKPTIKTLEAKGRIICIGDLHGCVAEAHELLRICNVTPDDAVVFLGDLVDRGPDNGECVDLAMKHHCVLGNHEERHIQYRTLQEAGRDPRVVSPTHVKTRLQLRAEHFDYFRSLPHIIRFPQHNAAAVHAGAFPGIPLDEQSVHHLLHIQMIKPPELGSKWPSKAPNDWAFWSTFWQGPERLIFGHSVIDRPLVTDKVVGIDGGAVFGRELWAFELPSGRVYRVKGRNNHESGSGRGREGKSVRTYPVHGDVSTFS
jgi:hypothetical protein